MNTSIIFIFLISYVIASFVYLGILKATNNAKYLILVNYLLYTLLSLELLLFVKVNSISIIIASLVAIWSTRMIAVQYLFLFRTSTFETIQKPSSKKLILQIASIIILLLPVSISLSANSEVYNPLAIFSGLVIWFLGFVVEGIEDYRRISFNQTYAKRKQINPKLYPSYLGEIPIWIGIFVICYQFMGNLTFVVGISSLFIIYKTSIDAIIPKYKTYSKKVDNPRPIFKEKKSTKLPNT